MSNEVVCHKNKRKLLLEINFFMGVLVLFYCGIDIAKNNHEASIIDARGKLLTESISFPNSQKGCEKLFKLFEKFEIIPENVVIGMEATGHYWLSVYSFLSEKCTYVKLKMIRKILL